MDYKTERTPHRWPQFTLRDVFWLVLLAAVLAAWGVDHHTLVVNFQTRLMQHATVTH